MMRLTEVVKHLLIVNVLIFFGTKFLQPQIGSLIEMVGDDKMLYYLNGQNRLYFAMFNPFFSEYFRPFQIITHMFMHGDESHLFFNMFGLFMFGPPLESRLGSKRFLIYYVLCGLGALLLHLLVVHSGTPMLGASGALFGVLLGYGWFFPNNKVMLLIPPIPMKAKYMVALYAGLELFLGLGSFQTGVAHFAHLGGAAAGLLIIYIWKKSGKLV